jgi:mannose/cellobiose epimerase-like protein (N-acyl-D-glucosamine 2-epimerase family)
LLAQECDVVTRQFWVEDAGAMVEEWDRSWSKLADYRGSNANMHSVEAFLAAADATGESTWRHRALRIAGRIIDGEARSRDWRIPEHHDQAWQVLPDYNRDRPADQFRPYGATPGHGLEWSRLLLHLAAALGKDAPDWLVQASRSLFARAVGDAWDGARGGLAYTTDWDGTPVVSARLYWVVAEGIGAAAALHAATGERSYAAWYAAFWDYARRVFIDPTGFGWIQEVDPDGTPVDGIWSGRPDFYHAAQAALIPRLPLAPSMTAALAAGVRPAGG